MLQLRLLGEPLLLDDVHRPSPLWRTHVALLAYLASSAEGAASRSALAGVFWPEVPEAAARRSLRQSIFQLRRIFGEVVEAEGELVRLVGSRIEVDARRFEELLDEGRVPEAVALYRDDFLAGFCLDSEPFDRWSDQQRARLAARAAAAFESLSARAAEEGRWSDALQWATRWAARAPFSEAAACRVVTLRAQAGDRGGALAEVEAFRARLRAGLDLEPSDEVEQLAARIQGARAGNGVTAFLVPPAAGARSPEPLLPLIGREAEFARLHHCWEEACAGRGHFVLVTGEAGIGKTRLVQEFAGWARLGGATVLRGRAYVVERGVPYSTLAGVLRGALDAPGLAAVDAASLGELSRIVPEFATRFRGVEAPPAADLDTGRVRLLEALRRLFENLAFEAPVLLLLDDLPWADEPTLASLHYLWRTLEGHPLLVLATARTEDSLNRLLTSLFRESPGRTCRLALEPLEIESIALLAKEVGVALADTAAAAALREETGGNPLFLAEALRARLEGTPTSASATVRTVISERVAGLSPAARELLRAASVLGRRFPFPSAAALAGLPHPGAIDALEELLSRRLLQQVEFEYDFLHDVVRETVYEELGGERRRMLHRMALERLAPGPDEEVRLERAGRLVMHASRAGMRPEARHWLLRSAELARRLFAGADAERFLEQALEVSDADRERGAVLERIADLHFARSCFADAALAYHQVVPTTTPGSIDRLRLRTKLLDASLRAGLLDLDAAAEVIEALAADAEAAGPACRRDVLVVVANAQLRAGHFSAAEEQAAGAVDAARAAGEPRPLFQALLLRAQTASFRPPSAQVLPMLEEAIVLAAAHGWQRERCDAETDHATELCRQGRWDEAIRGWSGVLQRAAPAGAAGALAVAHVNLSDVLIRRGEWERARAHLAEAEALSDRHSFVHLSADVRVNRALMHWHRGEAEATVHAAAAALEHARAHGLAAVARSAIALRVLGLLELDLGDEALREVQALSAMAGSHSTWSDDGEIVTVARARMAVHQGDHGAERLLRGAIEVALDPHATALLQMELAELLRDGDPTEAARLTTEAAACAARLGAEPLLERAARMNPVAGSAPSGC